MPPVRASSSRARPPNRNRSRSRRIRCPLNCVTGSCSPVRAPRPRPSPHDSADAAECRDRALRDDFRRGARGRFRPVGDAHPDAGDSLPRVCDLLVPRGRRGRVLPVGALRVPVPPGPDAQRRGDGLRGARGRRAGRERGRPGARHRAPRRFAHRGQVRRGLRHLRHQLSTAQVRALLAGADRRQSRRSRPLHEAIRHMKIAIIAGAGPAGLTAAHELLAHTDVKPIVIELDTQVGGISKTINYRGNRMDLGGHRFFSKSDWVMNWWQNLLPVAAGEDAGELALAYQGQTRAFTPAGDSGASADQVMLVRSRLSRIYYRRRFFDYPLKLSYATLRNLGLGYTAAV